VVGVYVATINHFMFGPLFEKGLSLKAGQTPCQKYWPELLEIVTSGECHEQQRIRSCFRSVRYCFQVSYWPLAVWVCDRVIS